MNRFTARFFYPSNLKRKLLLLLLDAVSFTIAVYLAFLVRAELTRRRNYKFQFIYNDIVFLNNKITCILNLQIIRYFMEICISAGSCKYWEGLLLSNGILFIVIYGFNITAFQGFPRSIILIDLVLSFLFSSGFKISKRLYLEVMRQSIIKPELKRTLIIGAGSSGEQLLRDINRSQTRRFYPIGFVDDDPTKQNLYLQGIRVLGSVVKLPEIIKKYNVESILNISFVRRQIISQKSIEYCKGMRCK